MENNNCSLIDNSSLSNGIINCSFIGNSTSDIANIIILLTQSLVFGIITLVSIIGNLFVIGAVLFQRSLQNVSNYLIVSLAVADLLVACLVMPLGAVYQITKGWTLGPVLCEIWTSSDILCCTASIWNLVAIALDRYSAVTDINYTRTRSGRRIVTTIAVVWSISLAVALAPQFGWKDPNYIDRIKLKHVCIPSMDFHYITLTYLTNIFIPLPVILVLYWKIYQTAKNSCKWRREQRNTACGRPKEEEKSKEHERRIGLFVLIKNIFMKKTIGNNEGLEVLNATKFLDEGQSTSSSIYTVDDDSIGKRLSTSNIFVEPSAFTKCAEGCIETTSVVTSTFQDRLTTLAVETTKSSIQNLKEPSASVAPLTNGNPASSTIKRDEITDRKEKRENKTAKILAIITGTFIFCWMPFFILNFLMIYYNISYVNPYLMIIFYWMPYFNSTLNPIIYTVFSHEFRKAFRILFCCVRCKVDGGTDNR